MKRFVWLACLLGIVAMLPGMASAAYPNRQITIVVPYGPAGNNGTMARMMAPFLSEKLGVQVAVVNKPGGNTAVGLDYFLRQPADGYTVLLTTLSPAIANLVVKGKVKEDIYEKLSFMNGQSYNPYLFVVPKNSPFKSVNDVYAKLKAEPKSLSGTTVAGGGGHAAHFQLLDAFNLPHESLRLVTYSSGNQCLAALMGNQVDFATSTAVLVSRMTESVTPLAVLDSIKSTDFPDVPLINDVLKAKGTSIEALPGSLVGWACHAELQKKYPARYKKLMKALEEVTKDPAVKEAMIKAKTGYDWIGPKTTAKIVKDGYKVVSTNKYGQI